MIQALNAELQSLKRKVRPYRFVIPQRLGPCVREECEEVPVLEFVQRVEALQMKEAGEARVVRIAPLPICVETDLADIANCMLRILSSKAPSKTPKRSCRRIVSRWTSSKRS